MAERARGGGGQRQAGRAAVAWLVASMLVALLAACGGRVAAEVVGPIPTLPAVAGPAPPTSGPAVVAPPVTDIPATTTSTAPPADPVEALGGAAFTYCGPGVDATLAELQAAAAQGIDLLGPPCSGDNSGLEELTPDQLRHLLDLAGEAGVRLAIYDPDLFRRSDGPCCPATWLDDARANLARATEVVDRYRGHPALAGFYLMDEPSFAAAPLIGEYLAVLRRHDPSLLYWVNLLPRYADAERLGGHTWEAYVEAYLASPDWQIVSFDNYDSASRVAADVAWVAERAGGRPLWISLLTVEWSAWNTARPDRAELNRRCAMARQAGATACYYFPWRIPPGSRWTSGGMWPTPPPA